MSLQTAVSGYEKFTKTLNYCPVSLHNKHSHLVSAGVRGVLPEQPAQQVWTGKLCLDIAAH